MDNLFLLLMIASIGALITALIKPLVFQKIFKNKATRKNLSIYFIGSTIIFFVLFGITTDPIEQITEIDTPTTANQQEQAISNTEQQKNEAEITKKQPQTEANEQTTNNTPSTNTIATTDQEQPASLTKINQSPTSTKIEDKPAPTASETISQKNAVAKAKSFLGYSAFSHDGLIAQLEYEQFSHADAVYGTDNSGANWNEQVTKKAKSYMEYSAFSRDSLIEQLKYDKFTQVQAEYGANAAGL